MARRAPGRIASLDDAYAHCAGVSRASGSSFLAAFWLFPREQRRALHAIYAFCRAADDIADDASVRGDREGLLLRWRDRLLRKSCSGCANVNLASGSPINR